MMEQRMARPEVHLAFAGAVVLLVVIAGVGVERGAPPAISGAHHAGERPAGPEPPWIVHIRALEGALARGELGAAEMAWHGANGEALRSRDWSPMIAAGDAALRIGEAASFRRGSEPRARQAYLSAFIRARGAGSLEGVVRVTEAFARLGDAEVVERCLRAAEAMPGWASDAGLRERAQILRGRLTALPAAPRPAHPGR
jgi:hypothetical protein